MESPGFSSGGPVGIVWTGSKYVVVTVGSYCATSSDVTTTILSNALPTDATINVVSTTGYPTSGIVIINGEVISYTGVTSTSFTGCSRGQYSTQAYSDFIGDIVYIGAWLVKINYGYLFAGYQVPS